MVNRRTTTEYSQLQERFEELQRKERYLTIINDFAVTLLEETSMEGIVWSIAKQVIAKMGFEDCVIYLMDKEKQVLVQRAAHGPKNPEKLDIYNPITIPVGRGVVGTAAQTGEVQVVADTRKDKRYIIDDSFRLSELSVPILYKNEVIGIIDSENSEPDFFTDDHIYILKAVAAISSIKIMHAKALEELRNHQVILEEKIEERTEELHHTIERLHRSNQDLESFAYAASHDLKQPLRTITSYLQLLELTEKDLSQNAKEYLEYAVKGSKRMHSLLEGLLSYSRLRKNEEAIMEVDLNQLLENVLFDLEAAIQSTNAQIKYYDLPVLKGNPTQLSQLFQNILSNAIKFAKPEESPEIEIKYSQKKEVHLFEIQDNGIGIPDEFKEKVFKLFSKLHTPEQISGSGIGLALCKRIVETHNGKIWIESEEGKGTTFFIQLPR